MTKEELIEKHWGHLFPLVKHLLDKDGVMKCDTDFAKGIFWDNGDYDFFDTFPEIGYGGEEIGILEFTPHSLSDIIDNNGWTKYVDENTWPTERDIMYDVCKFHLEEDNPSEPLKIHRRMTALEVIHLCNDRIITHWREHKEEPKPKY